MCLAWDKEVKGWLRWLSDSEVKGCDLEVTVLTEIVSAKNAWVFSVKQARITYNGELRWCFLRSCPTTWRGMRCSTETSLSRPSRDWWLEKESQSPSRREGQFKVPKPHTQIYEKFQKRKGHLKHLPRPGSTGAASQSHQSNENFPPLSTSSPSLKLPCCS